MPVGLRGPGLKKLLSGIRSSKPKNPQRGGGDLNPGGVEVNEVNEQDGAASASAVPQPPAPLTIGIAHSERGRVEDEVVT